MNGIEEKLPDFLFEKLKTQYGKGYGEILTGYTRVRPVTFRVNTLKARASDVERELGFEVTPAPVPNAFIVHNATERDICGTEVYRNGKIYLQSLSSMLPPFLLNPQAGESILDMTAAPGGKTGELSALSDGKAFLTAVEKDKIRFERLKYNLKKLGVPRVSLLNQDALSLDDYFRFDKILLDAPCSGSGTLDLRYPLKISQKLVENSAKLQEKLLKKALKLLKEGAVMVYSTCSVLKEENEEVLMRVLSAEGASLLPARLPFDVPRLPSAENTLLVPPNELFEGFFCALIQKGEKKP